MNVAAAASKNRKKAATASAARKAEAMRNFEWTDDLIRRYANSDVADEALPEEIKQSNGPHTGRVASGVSRMYD